MQLPCCSLYHVNILWIIFFFSLVPLLCRQNIIHFETTNLGFELLFALSICYSNVFFSLMAIENSRSRKDSQKQKRMAVSCEKRCPHPQEATVSGRSCPKYMILRRITCMRYTNILHDPFVHAMLSAMLCGFWNC